MNRVRLRELAGHARALRRDRGHARHERGHPRLPAGNATGDTLGGPAARRSTGPTSRTRTTRRRTGSRRDLISKAKGRDHSAVHDPGASIENNTKPDGAWDFFNGVTGPKRGLVRHVGPRARQRHRRERGAWRWAARAGSTRVMRWYEPVPEGHQPQRPRTRRLQWSRATAKLARGSRTGRPPTRRPTRPTSSPAATPTTPPTTGPPRAARPTARASGTFSPAFHPRGAPSRGVPKLTVNETSPVPERQPHPGDVYDLDSQGNATLISRGAYLLGGTGTILGSTLYGDDWVLPAGHRLGVLIGSSNSEWWTPHPHLPERHCEQARR